MTSLVLYAVLAAPAQADAEPTLTLTHSAVTVLQGSADGVRFQVQARGTLADGAETHAITRTSTCALSLSNDTLACLGQLTIDGESAEVTLRVTGGGEAAWRADSALGLSDAALTLVIDDAFRDPLAEGVEGAIHGWTWPDGETPGIIIRWLLQDLLERDDVLIYVDGVCMNCLEKGIF